MPKQIHQIDSFHGGLNSSADPRDISDNELSDAQDIMVDELGMVRLLGGTSAHDADNNPTVTIEPGYGLFQFSHDRKGSHVQVSDLSGTHTGSNDQDGGVLQPMVDNVAAPPTNSMMGATINNTEDGSSGAITVNVGGNIGCLAGLTGGTGDDWDTDDTYTITDFPETGEDYLVLANTLVFTEPNCDVNSGSTSIAHDDTETRIVAGLSVSGTGIPSGAYIVSKTDSTNFVISAAATASTDPVTLTFGGGLQIYARNNDKWSTGAIINLGSTTGMKPTIYNVDGALRISDGNFGSGNNNRWYGYIDREFFGSTEGNEVVVNGWVNRLQKIEKPAAASVFNNSIATVAPTYSTSGTIAERTSGVVFFDTQDTIYDKSGTIANVMKIVVVVHATAEDLNDNDLQYTLKVGMSLDATTGATTFSASSNQVKQTSVNTSVVPYSPYTVTHTFTFDVDDLVMNNGTTSSGIRAYCDFTGTGDHIDHKEIHTVTVYEGAAGGSSHSDLVAGSCHFEFEAGGSDGSGWDKDWNIGCSFIYDGVQESLITELADVDDSTDTDLAALTSTQHPIIKLSIKYSGWNERVTGINLYMREVSAATTHDWYLQCTYNLIDGTGRQYPNGTKTDFIYVADHVEYSCEIPRDNLKQPNVIGSYQSETGYKNDEKSIISKYKTAVVAGRIVYIGGLELQNEDGTTEVKGDTMIKSPVNKFDMFPLSRIVEASVSDGDEIVKLEEYADRILQFKKKKMHLINVSQDIEFLEDTFLYKGVSHPAATCKTDFGIAWVNENGVYLYDGQRVSNLFEKGGMQMIKESEWTNFLTVDKDGTGGSLTPMIGYLPKKRQLIVYDDISNTSNGYPQMYLYDMVTQSWINGSSDATNRVIDIKKTNFVTDWNGDLVYAHTNGTVVKWDDASDATDGSQLNILTKDIDFGQPGIRKKIHRVHVTYRSTGDSGVRVQFGVDGRSSQGYDFSYSSPSTNFGSGTLDDSSGEWQVAELVPDTSSESTDKKSIRLQFWDNAAVPADFAINDISIVYRLKSLR